MLVVLRTSWTLLFGMLLLLMGNGVQGTLLGIRGGLEGIDAAAMSLVMSGYYLGFLVGSRRAPVHISRVGHVRVFAALAALVSAAFILYAAAPVAWAWALLRILVGYCFAGIYVVAESWLNDAATNETRGKALSLYMITQMVGIISAQGILVLADPGGYIPFVVMSVLVSISVGPILLTAGHAPAFATSQRMSLRNLFRTSPLGCVGTFALGGVYAAIFGMGSVFGTAKGLTVAEISAFVAVIYLGGLVAQYPIGWLSDRMDRRGLILGLTAFGALATALATPFSDDYRVLLVLGLVIGGVANPLYSLLIAHTNDFLAPAEMASASGGLLFINGLGAIAGPVVIGALMTRLGPDAYLGYLAVLFGVIATYAFWRSTRRLAPAVAETAPYQPIAPQASPVALGASREVALGRAAAAGRRPGGNPGGNPGADA